MFSGCHLLVVGIKNDCCNIVITTIRPQGANPFATGHTPVCGYVFKPADNITVHVVQRKHFFEILENLEEIFHRYLQMTGICHQNPQF